MPAPPKSHRRSALSTPVKISVLPLDQTVYALDATAIDLCLSLFPCAPHQRSKAILLDLRGNIPRKQHSGGHGGPPLRMQGSALLRRGLLRLVALGGILGAELCDLFDQLHGTGSESEKRIVPFSTS
jgi:hypothetical protein